MKEDNEKYVMLESYTSMRCMKEMPIMN
jgi:hypothetical protein